MKATKIYYEELRTTGQYNNKKIGVELQVEKGEKASDVLKKAKIFVQAALLSEEALKPEVLESFLSSMKYAADRMENAAKKAQASFEIDDEIPF